MYPLQTMWRILVSLRPPGQVFGLTFQQGLFQGHQVPNGHVREIKRVGNELVGRTMLCNPKIFQTLLRQMTLPEIMRLRSLDTRMDRVIRKYVRRFIFQAIDPWFQDREGVLDIMRWTCSIITGPPIIATAFHQRSDSRWISIVVHRDFDVSIVTDYLRVAERYHCISEGAQLSLTNGADYQELWQKEVPVEANDNDGEWHGCGDSGVVEIFRVLVMKSCLQNAVSVMATFSETAEMCWITGDSFHVGYPGLLRHGMSIVHPDTSFEAPYHDTYISHQAALGRRIIRSVRELPFKCGEACPTLWRTTRDVATLVLPLTNRGEENVDGHAEYQCAWTLAPGRILPSPECSNANCSRTRLMFPRRDGEPPRIMIRSSLDSTETSVLSTPLLTASPTSDDYLSEGAFSDV